MSAAHGARPLRQGAQLPYKLLAGVEPHRAGWLVATGKLQGVSLFPEPAMVFGSLLEILDSRPAFEVVALHSPIGLPDTLEHGGRSCDRAARALLGAKRGTAIVSPPPRSVLRDDDGAGLSAIGRRNLPRTREVQRDVASYHQRVVFEVHPELGFFHIHDEQPLATGRDTDAGQEERRSLLLARMPGVERVLERLPHGVSEARMLDAYVNLWTARRIAAKAIVRLPAVPEWNEDGLRMELVY